MGSQGNISLNRNFPILSWISHGKDATDLYRENCSVKLPVKFQALGPQNRKFLLLGWDNTSIQKV